jgi:FkbM family methyltransferase
MNWSAIDPRSTRGRIVRLPAKLLPKSTVMRIRSGPARGMKWISGSATHGCWLGTYELEKQKVLEHIVKPGMTVYDVGAQAGFYTLLCSRLVGDQGRVIAFEPSISEARYLLEHVRINHLANVSVVQAAVGASPALSGFSSGRAMCQNRLTVENDKLLVPVISLDSVALRPPNVIKIDIEGGESDAVKGARALLVKHQPIVVLALHGPEHARFCPEFLRSCGYRVFDLADAPVTGTPVMDEIYARPAAR